MQKHNQDGSIIVTILLSVLLIASLAFGYWTYTGKQDYKNNSDKKVSDAVAAAEKVKTNQLNAQFAEESKNPNKIYQGPTTFGTVTFAYPKTWSAYVDESNQAEPINGYFHPDKVPGIGTGAAFALRAELITGVYSQLAHQFDTQVKSGKIKAATYVPPKMNGVPNVQVGTRFDGELLLSPSGPLKGSMVIIPVRDRVLKIYTLSNSFLPDFDNIILPTLTFVP